MKRFFACTFILSIVLSSCHFFGGERVRGDGNVVTQARDIKGFSSVEISSALDVYITQDSNFAVKVEADNNLQELIQTRKEGNVLYIRQANNTSLEPTRDIKIYISAPLYNRLDVSGASGIKSMNRISSTEKIEVYMSGACHGELDIKAPSVSIDQSGACNLTLRGESKEASLQASGSSDIKAFDFLTETMDVDVNGASHADVFASSSLKAVASGASQVRYKGNATASKDASGASSVDKVD